MAPHWFPGNADLPTSGVTAGTYGDSTHVGQFTVAASGLVTAASNVAITGGGGGGGGGEIGYTEITSTVNITSTTESAGTLILDMGSLTFDGAPVVFDFFSPMVTVETVLSDLLFVSLFEGSTQIGRLAEVNSWSNSTTPIAPMYASYRFTPTAAAHDYKVTAHVQSTANTPSIGAGAGGTGTLLPAFGRFTKV